MEAIPIIHVFTVNTDTGAALDNWLMSAQILGYKATVLGLGKKWGGWAWRARLYHKTLVDDSSINPDGLVVLCDGNDLFFQRPPQDLYKAYLSYEKPIIFGGEPTCCTGHFSNVSFRSSRDTAMNIIESRHPLARYKFPNAGFIMGPKGKILLLLQTAFQCEDDQASYLEQYLKDPNFLAVDYYQRLVGNVNAFSLRFCVDCSLGDDKYRSEAQYWQYQPSGRDGYPKIVYQSKISAEVPCVLHFPGKNIVLYNEFGNYMYGIGLFKQLKVPTEGIGNSSGYLKANALLGMTKWWKGKS